MLKRGNLVVRLRCYFRLATVVPIYLLVSAICYYAQSAKGLYLDVRGARVPRYPSLGGQLAAANSLGVKPFALMSHDMSVAIVHRNSYYDELRN